MEKEDHRELLRLFLQSGATAASASESLWPGALNATRVDRSATAGNCIGYVCKIEENDALNPEQSGQRNSLNRELTIQISCVWGLLTILWLFLHRLQLAELVDIAVSEGNARGSNPSLA